MAQRLPFGFRPNIIYIKFDDFRVRDGFSSQAMPYLASLASQTIFYPNAVCVVPLCAPNRRLSYVGMHAQRAGVINNGDGASVDWSQTWAHALRANSYRTLLYGKHMNEWNKNGGWGSPTNHPWGFGHVECTSGAENYVGWDVCKNGLITSYTGNDTSNYCTDVESTAIAAAVAAVKPPFAIYYGCKASHSDDNDLAVPATRHAATAITVTRETRRLMPYNGTQPQWVYDFYPDQWSASELNTFDTRQIEAMRSCLSADELIQALVTALTARGLHKTTFIFVDVDNGFAGGDHGNDQKGTLFEECINSGLRIICPSQLGLSGVRTQRASAIDMMETFCEMTGSVAPVRGHGMSLVPSMLLATANHRKEAFINALKDGNGNPLTEGIRGIDYTAARGTAGSVRAANQTWCWSDVNQQLTAVALSTDQRSAIDTIKSYI